MQTLSKATGKIKAGDFTIPRLNIVRDELASHFTFKLTDFMPHSQLEICIYLAVKTLLSARRAQLGEISRSVVLQFHERGNSRFCSVCHFDGPLQTR